mmetsp:Transcript_34196/g.66820  ORF Transcript_34196/g.66820 Transcript_34196/m.66820 type:complete len:239 (+) Transcript_34196:65-781(+)
MPEAVSSAEYQQHENEITRLEVKLDQLIADLSGAFDSDAQAEVKVQIRKVQDTLEECLDRAKLCAEEQESDGLRGSLLAKLHVHTAQFEQVNGRVRRAMVEAKARRDETRAREREQLLGATSWESVQSARLRGSTSTGKALAKSAEVTEGLQRLRNALAADMERTAATSSVLDASSKVISSTQHETGTIDSRLSKARNLLMRIGRRNCTDFSLVIFGILIFLSVVLYIAKRRVYDKFL